MNPVVAFSKLPLDIDTQVLQRELDQHMQSDWQMHVNQKVFEGEWDVLPLRVPREHLDSHPILQCFAIESAEQWANLPLLEQIPSLLAIVQQLQCPVLSVRLMRLRTQAHIKPHRDYGLCLEQGQARLHVPICTSEQVNFKVAGQSVPMQAGELWYINANLIHEVHNHSPLDRINLVIDCKANTWLNQLISNTTNTTFAEDA